MPPNPPPVPQGPVRLPTSSNAYPNPAGNTGKQYASTPATQKYGYGNYASSTGQAVPQGMPANMTYNQYASQYQQPQQQQRSSGYGSALPGATGVTGTLGNIASGIMSVVNPASQLVNTGSQAVNTISNAWNVGKGIVNDIRSWFGWDKEEKAEQERARLAEEERKRKIIENERKQMMEEEVSDQERRARAQQYSQHGVHGDVDWEYDENGTPIQKVKLSEYDQAKQDAAKAMIGQVGSQEAVQKAVDDITKSQIDMYHRNNDEANAMELRSTQERLLARGITEGTPAWNAAMKQVQDKQALALQNATDQATVQGYQLGNESYKNLLAGYQAMNDFADPLSNYGPMAGADAYSQSSVQSAWQYGAGREDSRAQQEYQQQQMAQQNQQFYDQQAWEAQQNERRYLQENNMSQLQFQQQQQMAQQNFGYTTQLGEQQFGYTHQLSQEAQDYNAKMAEYNYDRQFASQSDMAAQMQGYNVANNKTARQWNVQDQQTQMLYQSLYNDEKQRFQAEQAALDREILTADSSQKLALEQRKQKLAESWVTRGTSILQGLGSVASGIGGGIGSVLGGVSSYANTAANAMNAGASGLNAYTNYMVSSTNLGTPQQRDFNNRIYADQNAQVLAAGLRNQMSNPYYNSTYAPNSGSAFANSMNYALGNGTNGMFNAAIPNMYMNTSQFQNVWQPRNIFG